MPAAFLDGLKPTSVVPGFPDWSNAPTRRAHRLSLILIVSQQPKPERPMRPPYSTLTPTRIYDYAAALLEFHLQWQDHSPKCTVKVLLQVLFYAAATSARCLLPVTSCGMPPATKRCATRLW